MPHDLSPSEIRQRADRARELSRSCRLCPRQCGVDRLSGERGFCQAGPVPYVATALPHFGEEPPIVGEGGAGTIFFSGCNLRCVFCQNHQISRNPTGTPMTAHRLAQTMLELQASRCATIEPVSPGHHLPVLLEALASAVENGLELPVVYNTNGYESPEALALLAGVIDVYLPDLKYADDAPAEKYSHAPGYVEIARSAILEMHRQVGNLVVDLSGTAVRGLIIRVLILPNDLGGYRESFRWIRDNLPAGVTVSIMAQYSPLHHADRFPELARPLTQEEYDDAIDFAWDLGLENAFIQELEAQTSGIPDFRRVEPFDWT